MSSRGLSVQLIRDPDALRSLATESEALSLAMRPRLPFTTVDWLTLWWKHYREQRLLVEDEFYLHTLRDQAGRLVALAPLVLTHRPSMGPVRARGLSFFGADRNITELRGLICAPEDEGLAAKALVQHLETRAHDWDWFAWHGVRRDGEAHAFLSGLPSFEWRREVVGYELTLADSWEAFRSTRSRNVKESLRKCYNSLKRDGHRFEFHVAQSGVDLWRALDRFFELHTLRSLAPQLSDHADYFAPAAARGLLRDLARTPERLPRLRVFELVIDGRVVASRLGFVLQDELYLYFSGFDPVWARYSVMTTTVAEAIKWAIEQGLKYVNLSPGTDVSKTRWSPAVYATCNGILVSPSRRGPLIWRLINRLGDPRRGGRLSAALTHLARRRG